MSDSKDPVTKLPFEPKPSQFMAIRTLPAHHARYELKSVPLSLITPYISEINATSGDRQYPNDEALAAKLTEIRFLPPAQLKDQFKTIIDSDNYDEVFKFASKFHERQRLEIISTWSRLKEYESPDKSPLYRHAAAGNKFANQLFATPDVVKARKEFPEVPMKRRSEWLDIMLRTIAVSAAEPEALRLKKCLVGQHQPMGNFAIVRPCMNYSSDYQAAIEQATEARRWSERCFADWTNLRNNVLETPDFDLAKRSYEKFASCVRGARISASHRANVFAGISKE